LSYADRNIFAFFGANYAGRQHIHERTIEWVNR